MQIRKVLTLPNRLQVLSAATRPNTTGTAISDIDLLLKRVNETHDEFVRDTVDTGTVDHYSYLDNLIRLFAEVYSAYLHAAESTVIFVISP